MRHHAARGISLLEVTVSVALAAMVALTLSETVSIASRAQMELDAVDRGTRAQQDALAGVRDAAFSAIRVVGDDDVGRSLFTALETGSLDPLNGTRLPVLDTTGSLDADEDKIDRTGNALLVVTEDRPIELTVAGDTHRFDIVRVVAFYLSATSDRVTNDGLDRLDLVKFTSVPFVAQPSIDRIAGDANEEALLRELRTAGLTRIMDLDSPADEAFSLIGGDDRIAPDTTDPPLIPAATDFPLRRVLLGKRMSVAHNSVRARVPRFARLDPDAPEFPGGFEVKVVGPWAAARVLVRLALVSGGRGGHDVVSDVTKIVTIGAR